MAMTQSLVTNRKSFLLQILPVMLCFFAMGFVDLVGTASNYVQKDLGLTDSQANLFPSLVFFWFLIFSVPTGMLMNKIGRKNTVLISLVVTAASLLIPPFGDSYIVMLVSFSLLGIGNAIMQTSLNPLVTNLISSDKLASTLTFGQFVKAIASFLAPILAAWGATTIFPTFGLGWRALFVIYAVICFLAISLLAATPIDEDKPDKASSIGNCLKLLGRPFILLCFIGIMCHVGIDVGTNTTAPKIIIERLGLPPRRGRIRHQHLLHIPYDRLFPRRIHPAHHLAETLFCHKRTDDAGRHVHPVYLQHPHTAIHRHRPHRVRQLQHILHCILTSTRLCTTREKRSVGPHDHGPLRRYGFPPGHGLCSRCHRPNRSRGRDDGRSRLSALLYAEN